MGIFSFFKSTIKNIHWFDFAYSDTSSDFKFLCSYVVFLFCASKKEVAEFIDLKCNKNSHDALSIMYHRVKNRYIDYLNEKNHQLNELRQTRLSYSPELYKEEQERWTKRGLSEEEMMERRFGSDKQYTIKEDLQEPVLKMIKYNENIFYCIHDKINRYYPVDIYTIDSLQPVRVMRFLNLQEISDLLENILKNINDEFNQKLQRQQNMNRLYMKRETFYTKYGHIIEDYREWERKKQIYLDLNPQNECFNTQHKVIKAKSLRQVDIVKEAMQGQNNSLFDDDIF